MERDRKDEDKEPAPPPDGAEDHNSLEDAAEDAARALEKEERGGEGTAGFGDIG